MEKEYSEHFGQVIMVQGKCPAKHDFFWRVERKLHWKKLLWYQSL